MSEHSQAPFRLYRYCIWDADNNVIAVMVQSPGMSDEETAANARLFEKVPELILLMKTFIEETEDDYKFSETLRALKKLIVHIESGAPIDGGVQEVADRKSS